MATSPVTGRCCRDQTLPKTAVITRARGESLCSLGLLSVSGTKGRWFDSSRGHIEKAAIVRIAAFGLAGVSPRR